jgi:hypothetical protein
VLHPFLIGLGNHKKNPTLQRVNEEQWGVERHFCRWHRFHSFVSLTLGFAVSRLNRNQSDNLHPICAGGGGGGFFFFFFFFSFLLFCFPFLP